MRMAWTGLLLLGLALAGTSRAEAPAVAQQVFAPAAQRGPVVIVSSGFSGVEAYRDFSAALAAQGYLVVLVDGKDISIAPNSAGGRDGAVNLKAVIREARTSAHALPGKVALVGFSVGGIGTLAHGAPLGDDVAAVVLFYPALTFVESELKQLASRIRTPVLLLAGGSDTYAGCCSIVTMKALEAAAASMQFELVAYPHAGHAFNLKGAPPPFEYRERDAADAWQRTIAFLQRHVPIARP